MKYLDEYRDSKLVQAYAKKIKQVTKSNWTLMEICGGQTHSILKYGLEELLPDTLSIVHGPGCPVCVTPLEMIDKAISVALQPDVIFSSFGDMLRVPGSSDDLLSVKAIRRFQKTRSPFPGLMKIRCNRGWRLHTSMVSGDIWMKCFPIRRQIGKLNRGSRFLS